MSKLANNYMPVIDLFAGPGGLSEGFSSVFKGNKRVFDIKLSIEKDEDAHKTLELRSFFRQFEKGKVPDYYYKVLKEPNLEKRNTLKQILFEKFPKEYSKAKEETLLAELGTKNCPTEMIDSKLRQYVGNKQDWVLIGGPPCQAYSLVGRSRVGGIGKEDHRVYLYQEYLRIIAVHHPSVFVMENVKGLLSAKVNGEKVFKRILSDLRDPVSVFSDVNSPKYKIYSLSNEAKSFDSYGNPCYKNESDYLIESEKYEIPQKRHRIILLGIREDINIIPELLKSKVNEIKLKDIIGDLPKIRSGLSRSFVSSEIIKGKKKRYYKKEANTDENWLNIINSFRKSVISWNGFAKDFSNKVVTIPKFGTGDEFLKCKTPSLKNPLFSWFNDPRLNGTCNHESRTHLVQDLKRYMFSAMFVEKYNRFPRLHEYDNHSFGLMPDHKNAGSGKFSDRFRVQLPDQPARTITSHISKDGHYFIHYDADQCRSLTVREAARVQTFPDNYLFCGSRTAQYHQAGNAVPPYLAFKIARIVQNIFIKEPTLINKKET